MPIQGSITPKEVVQACHELGGEAAVTDIASKVILNRGRGIPDNYQSGGPDSYRKTIIQKVHIHCPGYEWYRGPQYFEKVARGRVELVKAAYDTFKLMPPGQIPPQDNAINTIFPNEFEADATYYEGASHRVLVNRYERDRRARMKCIEHFGAYCQVCSFDFAQKYGIIGKGIIHVHHTVPITDIGADYQIDPITDLQPVCPNCHMMLHQRKPPYSIDELREIMQELL